MAHDVFVSYSQQDKQVADAVVARLEQDGVRCWIAPRDITPGTSWGDAIVAAIGASRIMVLVLSSESNRSRQVVREVQRAVADDVVILPFRIEAIDPTGAMAYFLGTEHWLDALTPPVERHIERLRRTVGALLSGGPIDREHLDTPPQAVARRRRRPWLPWAAAGTAAAAVTGATLALALGGGGAPPPDTTPPPTTTTTVVTVGLDEAGGYQPIDLDPADGRPADAIYGIDVDGSRLAYAAGTDGVTVASVASPARPLPMATYAGYGARAVAIEGDWVSAVLGEYGDELLVFHTDGTGGGTVPLPSADPSEVVADGTHLYLAGHNYIGIVDVTDPAAPALVYEWTPPGSTGNPATVLVADGTGYFGAGWDGLYLFDLSDPEHPAALSHWPSPNWVTGIAVADGLAYVTLGESGLAVLDVSDPRSPRLEGIADLPGHGSYVQVAHGHAFVGWFGSAGQLGGVAVIDVRDPADPVFLETYGRFQSITGLEVVGDHVIVADEASGLTVFEITGIAP